MSLSSFSYTFDLDICTFVLTISIDDNNIIQSKDIRVETKDVYKNNENAMQWIELLDAIFSGEQVLFPELGNLELHTKSQQNHPFKWFKKYYEYVRIIELHSHTSFTQYNNFTPERFEIAIPQECSGEILTSSLDSNSFANSKVSSQAPLCAVCCKGC